MHALIHYFTVDVSESVVKMMETHAKSAHLIYLYPRLCRCIPTLSITEEGRSKQQQQQGPYYTSTSNHSSTSSLHSSMMIPSDPAWLTKSTVDHHSTSQLVDPMATVGHELGLCITRVGDCIMAPGM